MEATHFDKDKPQRYAELGVCEMWRDGKKGSKQFHIEILDLLGGNTHSVIMKSLMLDGLTSSDLPEAFRPARSANIVELQELLTEQLAPKNNSEKVS